MASKVMLKVIQQMFLTYMEQDIFQLDSKKEEGEREGERKEGGT